MVMRSALSTPRLGVGADGGVVGDGMKVRSRSSRRAGPLKLQGRSDLRKLNESFTMGIKRNSNTMAAALYDVEGFEVVWG
jgi:hypothetical protein